MRLMFNNLTSEEKLDYEGEVETLNNLNHLNAIKEIKSVKGTIKANKVDSIIFVNFDLTANLIVYSSVSNEPFEYKLKIKDLLTYTNDENMANDDIFYEERNFVDLEEEIYSLIVANLPIQLHKKGEKYVSGDSYQVLTEEEYLAQKDAESSSPFDALLDIDVDE